MKVLRPDCSRSSSAPPRGARAGLPWLLALAVLGACASETPKDKEATPWSGGPSDTPRTLATSGTGEDVPAAGVIAGEPGYPKVPESPGTEESPPAEISHTVHLGVVSVTTEVPHLTLPEHVRVAVASIRGGKLARRIQLLRGLSRALGKESGVESVVALARLDAQAKDPAGLADLARVAAAQGAHLLLVEERTDEACEPTLSIVVDPASGAVLACARTQGDKPGAGKTPTSKLAALIRSVR